jgi:hypothetical protein
MSERLKNKTKRRRGCRYMSEGGGYTFKATVKAHKRDDARPRGGNLRGIYYMLLK